MSRRFPPVAIGTTPPVVTPRSKGVYRAAVGLFFSNQTAEIHATDCEGFEEARYMAQAIHTRLRRQHGLPPIPPPPPPKYGRPR